MQVRRFEARSMKEALEMVKCELGPEAVILSARDNSKRFGLVGDGSVEITAAVSEETMKKRKALESKMRGGDWENFKRSPARSQKLALERAFHAKQARGAMHDRNTRYVDIEDDEHKEMESDGGTKGLVEAKRAFLATSFRRPEPQQDEDALSQRAEYPRNARVKAAAHQAFEALRESSKELLDKQQEKNLQLAHGEATQVKEQEIAALKSEINGLRKLIEQFQGMQSQAKSTYPGADYDLPYELSSMYEHLTQRAGVLPEYAAEILTDADESLDRIKLKKKAVVEAFVAKKIYQEMKVVESPILPKVNIYLGARGGGKTAAIIKQASHWALQGKKVAVLTTDTIKVGAIDQLRIYTQILNIPFGILREPEDWSLAEQELQGVDHILVDFPGMSLKRPEEMQFLYRMLPPQRRNGDRAMHLVISATKKDSDIAEVAERYAQVGFDDVIFTCLDEVTQHGVIYNFQKRFGTPLHSFGIGPRIPEDFESATKERVVDLIFKLTQISLSNRRES